MNRVPESAATPISKLHATVNLKPLYDILYLNSKDCARAWRVSRFIYRISKMVITTVRNYEIYDHGNRKTTYDYAVVSLFLYP